MARVGGDAKLQPNHRGDPATGPDLPSKAIGCGAAVQEFGQAAGHEGPRPSAAIKWYVVLPACGAQFASLKQAFPFIPAWELL